MKQFTTPTISVRLDDSPDLIDSIVKANITISDGKATIDKEATLDGNSLSVRLTQEETGKLLGSIKIEVTVLLDDGNVIKSPTLATTIAAAVRSGEYD